MNYKDLILKITSKNGSDIQTTEINTVKKSIESKDILIGIMADEAVELSAPSLDVLKREVERTLTVLLNSPISDTFGFLPYSKKTLETVVKTFPEKRIHYIYEEEEYSDIKKMKQTNLNIISINKTTNKLTDFVKKINYLVTVNKELEPSLKISLDNADVMFFPIDIVDLEAPKGQKEVLVKPDGTGWSYNSASGMWVKTWGNDGMQEIPGW